MINAHSVYSKCQLFSISSFSRVGLKCTYYYSTGGFRGHGTMPPNVWQIFCCRFLDKFANFSGCENAKRHSASVGPVTRGFASGPCWGPKVWPSGIVFSSVCLYVCVCVCLPVPKTDKLLLRNWWNFVGIWTLEVIRVWWPLTLKTVLVFWGCPILKLMTMHQI